MSNHCKLTHILFLTPERCPTRRARDDKANDVLTGGGVWSVEPPGFAERWGGKPLGPQVGNHCSSPRNLISEYHIHFRPCGKISPSHKQAQNNN